VKPTGIIFIAFDKQKIQVIMEITQKIVGVSIVNPLVDFKNPFEVIPRIIAKNKKMYPEKLPIIIIKTIR
jgi:hypothetical protein